MPRVVLAALMLASVIPAHAQTAGPTGELEQRGQILLAPCAACHAVGTTGSSRHPDAPRLRTLARRELLDKFEAALKDKQRVSGPLDRHDFTFEPNEVMAIMAYLKTIQER
jgi:cytochrome c